MHRTHKRRRNALTSVLVWIGFVVGVAVFVVIGPTPTDAKTQAADGPALYATHCAGCHQPNGEGIAGTFPPLAGNTNATDAAYVVDVILNGRTGQIEVNGETYDTAMPAVGGLSEAEISALTDHVLTLAGADGADPNAPHTTAAPPENGDPDRGRDLFVGATRLDRGGAACSACHTAGDVGNLGGSSLGPDLTGTYDKFGGEAGLTAWLANPASPTMIPLFENDPLTPDETADLVAYLAGARALDDPSDNADWLTIVAAAGTVALLAAMAVAWQGMRQTYAQKLTPRSAR